MSNILVVGSMNMDIVTRVKELPKPGETIHGIGTDFHIGGKGANQACAASRSGAKVAMAGALGTDVFAENIREVLEKDGINTQYIVSKQGPTGMALITINDSGENHIILSPEANYRYEEQEVRQINGSDYDVILLQNEIPGQVNVKVLQLASAAGIPVCVNPAPMTGFDRNLLSQITYLIVNEVEAEELTGMPVHSFDAARQAAQYLLEQGTPHVIITLGSRGSIYLDRTGIWIETPAFTVPSVDSTAAGDTFIGAFIASYFGGNELKESLRYATAASALAVSAAGAYHSIPVESSIRSFLTQVEARNQ
ncbi:ribokinase [Paenibacillus sanguinis]|uniref:ribokinase n=1 Tax=Paenibacillus sanguinis TaxID=225906 RepID=UPI000363FBC9|nr:ribokinase [Paenibacillus sanguinis]